VSKDLSLLGNKIKQACLWAKGEGWKVEPDLFLYPEKKCCCPLTALAMQEGKLTPEEKHAVSFSRVLSWALLLDEKEVLAFTLGFDQVNLGGMGLYTHPEYYHLGENVRKWWETNPS
jgi:hypothetical protein